MPNASRRSYSLVPPAASARPATGGAIDAFAPLGSCVRSDMEALAVVLARCVLASQTESDACALHDAYDRAERRMRRSDAAILVRSVSAVVRSLRRERCASFRYLHPDCPAATLDELDLLVAIQSAIDGNPTASAASAMALAREGRVGALARDLTFLADALLSARPAHAGADAPFARAG